MSQFGPDAQIYKIGDYVLTPRHRPGKIVGSYREAQPQHKYWDWVDGGWTYHPDQYLEWIHQIEVNGEVQPWPEDMLTAASVLDMLVA